MNLIRIYVDCINFEALSEEAYRRKKQKLIEIGLEDKQFKKAMRLHNIDYDRAKTDIEYCTKFVDRFMEWQYQEMELKIY